MEVDCIPFKETGYFSQLICDYLDRSENLRPFYNRFPEIGNFKDQIEEKKATYPVSRRQILVSSLKTQYVGHSVSKSTQNNIDSLLRENTFTVVTGHQLNLFTGPLYFLYKIVSTINLTKKLKKQYPEYNFVPIYWMATEDHDFDEINYFNYGGRKIQWDRKASGAVGELDTNGLDGVFQEFSEELKSTSNGKELKRIFEKAYLEHTNLADATRYLVNKLFGEYGLVIVDGNDPELKKLLVPYAKLDIFEHLAHKRVTETINTLTEGSSSYNIQVNPREINYFYLTEGLRERLEARNGKYHVVNTKTDFSSSQLEEELNSHPERFSPNVIARPLYQEVVLPNLCYIGGGGELAYWMELKSYFEAMEVTFPMLLLRNSVLFLKEKQAKKAEKLGLSLADLFMGQDDVINKKIKEISEIKIDFTPQKELLEEQFREMYQLAQDTDKSFLGAVKAQEVKQKKGLDALEKRLLKAQKRKLNDHVTRITQLQNEIFPNHSLQERQLNFSELYMEMGSSLIPLLVDSLEPLNHNFLILRH